MYRHVPFFVRLLGTAVLIYWATFGESRIAMAMVLGLMALFNEALVVVLRRIKAVP